MSNLKYIVLLLVLFSFCHANEKDQEETFQESFTQQVRENVMLQYAAAYTGAEYDEKKEEKGLLESIGDAVDSVGEGASDLFGLSGSDDAAPPDLGITFEIRALKKEIQKALFSPVESKSTSFSGVPLYTPIYFYGPKDIASLSPETDAVKIAGLNYILERIVFIDDTWPIVNLDEVESKIIGELLESGTINDKDASLSSGEGASEEEGDSGANSSDSVSSGSSEVDYGF